MSESEEDDYEYYIVSFFLVRHMRNGQPSLDKMGRMKI